MKLPRDITGSQLCKMPSMLGYLPTRQTGSHIRLTTVQEGQHHVTIPRHDPIKVGTLAAILNDVAEHFKITRDELLTRIS